MTDMLAFIQDRALTPAERKKMRGVGTAKGYAALPGTGPAGETCGSCDHLYRHRLKCELMKSYWTGGHCSDVLGRSPACKRWSKATS